MDTPNTVEEMEALWEQCDEVEPLELARKYGASIRRLERLLDMRVPTAMVQHEQRVAKKSRQMIEDGGKPVLEAMQKHIYEHNDMSMTMADIYGNLEFLCREISIDLE